MPSGVFTVTNIPKSEVSDTISQYLYDNPTKIEAIRQNDGKWTVIATFPESKTKPKKNPSN